MITILLEKIITILEGWIQSFNSHAQHVEDKLDSLDQTASDIETNTEPISDIADNTGAVITPIQNIKSNTDSIATSSQTSANNTTAILNNIGTLSTNTGRAAAYAQDCANNTLDIKDKVTTIASDTTQIRANTATLEEIKEYLQWYFITNIVTEESEGSICSFDTDLEDYLQNLKVTIPADQTGFTGITLTKKGKNLLSNLKYQRTVNHVIIGQDNATTFDTFLSEGTYSININFTEGISGSLYITGETEAQRALGSQFPITITITKPEKYRLQVYRSSGLQTSDVVNYQLELSPTATAYEPYKAMTYPVSFGSTITDGAEINLLDGIIKINSTPVSYQSISPIAVRTYKGVNNIYSDIGTSALTYRETLKHYLDKNNQ